MPEQSSRVVIHGSERAPLEGAHLVGAVPENERLELTVRLRPRNPLTQLAGERVVDDALPQQRRYLSRKELAGLHAADPQDVKKINAFARQHGLSVSKSKSDPRSLTLSGTAAAFSAAFGVQLQRFEHPDGTFRGRSGALTVPSELDGIIEGVFGLDDRPQARPHYQVHGAASEAARANAFTALQLSDLYSFPSGLDGKGESIAIIELGGGYRTADLKAYFSGLGLPTPKVKTVKVDGGRNKPSTPDGADGEVMLDIEVAGTVAPRARIVVYFAPNTDRGFLDAINRAIHDTSNKPSVISISWGGPESSWTAQAMTQFDQAFQAAAAVGVTVCVAAGDNGSADGVKDGKSHVDFPASSPFVLGCGGTKLLASASTITSETVWNEGPDSATGGGASGNFPRPTYQKSVLVPGPAAAGRGVPDVAGDADPATGYKVRVDGQDMVIGGTSAVAPLWAGLISRFNQRLKTPVGFMNPLLYGSLASTGVCRDVTGGNNGAFSAGPGWDACTGWGSPAGSKLLASLGG